MSTLPHCTGCTEPGEPTHHGETVEHIHDACEVEIIVLRMTLEAVQKRALANPRDTNGLVAVALMAADALAQPLPPAAAKLLAERDAGRALFEAVTRGGGWSIGEAVEAYRKVVE